MRARAVALLGAAACTRAEPPPPPPLPPPAPVAMAKPVPADAATPDAAAVDASAAPPVAPPGPPLKPSPTAFVDTPAWPAAPGPLVLTWKLYPARVDPADPDPYPPDYPRVPVELVATLGGVERHIVLPADFGSLHARNQVQCAEHGGGYGLGPGEVAKVTFYEGGAGGYLVRRRGGTALEVAHWTQPDGACPGPHGEPTGCPGKQKRVVGLHVPAGVAITQQIVLVDASGEHPYACDSADP